MHMDKSSQHKYLHDLISKLDTVYVLSFLCLSTSLSICLSTIPYVYICSSVLSSVCSFVCPSGWLSVHSSVHLSVCHNFDNGLNIKKTMVNVIATTTVQINNPFCMWLVTSTAELSISLLMVSSYIKVKISAWAKFISA